MKLKTINIIFIVIIIVCFSGIVLAFILAASGLSRPNPDIRVPVFCYLYANYEWPVFLSFIVGSLFYLRLFNSSNHLRFVNSFIEKTKKIKPHYFCIGIGTLVFSITLFGTIYIHHAFPLSPDEFMSNFQAKIFLNGYIKQPVDLEDAEIIKKIQPRFTDFDPSQRTIVSDYFPIYALMRAPFLFFNLDVILNPLLAAFSVVLMYFICVKAFPTNTSARFIGPLLLLSSTQFLLKSMTAFSMPAHLCINLLWLFFYLNENKQSLVILPLIGFLAIGLHQPVPHALFVTPFIVRFFLDKKFKRFIYFVTIYAVICTIWLQWIFFVRPTTDGAINRLMEFSVSLFSMFIVQTMNITMLFAWNSILIVFLACVALLKFKSMPPLMKDIFWGALLTFVFYFFYSYNQGIAWGYRYFHSALGNLIIVSVFGFALLEKSVWESKVNIFMICSLIFSLFVLFPYRCYEVNQIVRPWANAFDYIRSLDSDIILFKGVYFGDIRRNDPTFDNRPLIVSGLEINEKELSQLKERGTYIEITGSDLSKFEVLISEETKEAKLESNDSSVSSE